MLVEGLDHERTIALAAAALGERLLDAVPLGGSQRSLVLRAVRAGGAGTVVVKRFAPEPEPGQGPNGFAREVAGLRLLEHAPTLLATDAEHEIVVMSDVGSHPTLADLLRGDDPGAAWSAAVDWARSLGEVLGGSHPAATVATTELRSRGVDREPGRERVLSGLEALAAAAGVVVPPDVRAEVDQVHDLLTSDAGLVVTPGDMCPDNVLLTPGGPAFVDLEATTVRPIAFDAAYVMLPFATCWCVYAQPPGLVDEMLVAFSTAVTVSCPGLLGYDWEQQGVVASVAWVLWMAPMLLHYAADAERRMGPPERPALSMREMLLLRLGWVARRAAVSMPATAAFAGQVAAGLRDDWGRLPAAVYPAWSGCC